MIVPTILVGLILPKKWILRWDKQILSCSIGTICAFLFIEVIPHTIHDIGEKFTEYNYDKSPTSCIYFGLVILFGMILAGSLELLEHDDHHHAESEANVSNGSTNTDTPNSNTNTNNQNEKSLFTIPKAVKTIIFATIIHNLVDGMMIGIHPSIAIPLFFHEITHAAGQLAIYVNLGIGKRKSLMIRLFTDLFAPIAAICTWFCVTSDAETNPIYCKLHIYGHCLLIGLFTYVLLADLLPILMESWNEDDNQSEIINVNERDIEDNNDTVSNQIQKSESQTKERRIQIIYVILSFILSFGAVTAVILLIEEHEH